LEASDQSLLNKSFLLETMIRSFGEKANYRSSYIRSLCGGDLWRRSADRGGGGAGIDWRSIFHPIKGGLVLGAISCALLSNNIYAALGKNVMWAILTVVVVFECTVGNLLNISFQLNSSYHYTYKSICYKSSFAIDLDMSVIWLASNRADYRLVIAAIANCDLDWNGL
jgi:hypothetical protein